MFPVIDMRVMAGDFGAFDRGIDIDKHITESGTDKAVPVGQINCRAKSMWQPRQRRVIGIRRGIGQFMALCQTVATSQHLAGKVQIVVCRRLTTTIFDAACAVILTP